jgi:hypothetical protein
MSTHPELRPPVPVPRLEIPGEVLALTLPVQASVTALVRRWVELDDDHVHGLRRQRRALRRIVIAATGRREPGDVAVLLRFVQRSGELVGGAAILRLARVEMDDTADPAYTAGPAHPAYPVAFPGTDREREPIAPRVRTLVAELEATATEAGHGDGLAEVGPRLTRSGITAARIRALALVPDGPLVEVCRWLYPLPDHQDLVWELAYQTTDLDISDELVAEFDALAASLTWADP